METIVRINSEHNTVFIVAHNVQRQVVGTERIQLLAKLAHTSAMIESGAWFTYTVKS